MAARERVSSDPSKGGLAAFIVAMVVIGLCAGGVKLVGWVEKLPVVWPQGVEVDDAFRNLSLVQSAGPFQIVEPGDPKHLSNDEHDGADRIFKSDLMSLLGIGGAADRRRYPLRQSNWYISRIYVDSRATGRNSPFRYWRLDVYYYTGLRDSVPHVPEICQEAGGATVTSENVFFDIPAGTSPWRERVGFRRVISERTARNGTSARAVEYYIFSVNGRPLNERIDTRIALNMPTVRHSYFAKIQFGPIPDRTIRDIEEVDRRAEEFMQHLLPHVLGMLPTKEDIRKLDRQLAEKKTPAGTS
ncbi:MAG: hypothetical protein ACYS8X_00265 [Planctomycetota bacterium]|jgi:hypothetical protein